jgi:hypothetical protein
MNYPRDKYHRAAQKLLRDVSEANFSMVTTTAILIEIGNALAREPLRLAGAKYIREILKRDDFEVVTVGEDLFEKGLALYEQRPDKEWSLTDCISFIVMRELNINLALTSDHHFEQAGFRVLLQ